MKISLRLRLTLLTSAILILMSVAFTLFTIYNANYSIQPAALTQAVDNTQISAAVSAIASTEISGYTEIVDTSTFSRNSLWFLGAGILIGSVLMYFMSGIILRPLKKFSKTVASVDKDGLETKIMGYNAGDELTDLATEFNTMLERLNGAFQRERRFSQSAAHELKTPLAVIKTNIQVMGKEPSKKECLEVLSIVKQQTDRITALLEQLLTVSAGNTLEWQQVDFAKLVSELALENEGVRLNLSQCSLWGNKILLRNAVENLIQNGIKYGEMPMEAVLKADGVRAVLEIKDSGQGIDKEDREKIFEPFYRVDKSRSRALGGSGLGLAITKEIIRLHGGEVTCLENKPRGTVFKIVIPQNSSK